MSDEFSFSDTLTKDSFTEESVRWNSHRAVNLSTSAETALVDSLTNETCATVIEGNSTEYFSVLDDDDGVIQTSPGIAQVGAAITEQAKGLVNASEEDTDQQMVLFAIDGIDALFGMQILKDESGNLRKYQFQMRQLENGEYEAIPETIQILPFTANADDFNALISNQEQNLVGAGSDFEQEDPLEQQLREILDPDGKENKTIVSPLVIEEQNKVCTFNSEQSVRSNLMDTKLHFENTLDADVTLKAVVNKSYTDQQCVDHGSPVDVEFVSKASIKNKNLTLNRDLRTSFAQIAQEAIQGSELDLDDPCSAVLHVMESNCYENKDTSQLKSCSKEQGVNINQSFTNSTTAVLPDSSNVFEQNPRTYQMLSTATAVFQPTYIVQETPTNNRPPTVPFKQEPGTIRFMQPLLEYNTGKNDQSILLVVDHSAISSGEKENVNLAPTGLGILYKQHSLQPNITKPAARNALRLTPQQTPGAHFATTTSPATSFTAPAIHLVTSTPNVANSSAVGLNKCTPINANYRMNSLPKSAVPSGPRLMVNRRIRRIATGLKEVMPPHASKTTIIQAPQRTSRLPRKQQITPLQRTDEEIIVKEVMIGENGFVEPDGSSVNRVPPITHTNLSNCNNSDRTKDQRRGNSISNCNKEVDAKKTVCPTSPVVDEGDEDHSPANAKRNSHKMVLRAYNRRSSCRRTRNDTSDAGSSDGKTTLNDQEMDSSSSVVEVDEDEDDNDFNPNDSEAGNCTPSRAAKKKRGRPRKNSAGDRSVSLLESPLKKICVSDNRTQTTADAVSNRTASVASDITSIKNNTAVTAPQELTLRVERRKQYRCTECSKVLPSYNALTTHQQYHAVQLSVNQLRNEKYKCHKCQLVLKNNAQLERHTCQPKKPHPANFICYTCEVCSNRFLTMKSFLDHKKVHTTAKEQIDSAITKNMMKFTKIASKPVSKSEDKDSALKCSTCQKECATTELLNMHVLRMHRNSMRKPIIMHKCMACKGLFPSQELLDVHMRKDCPARLRKIAPNSLAIVAKQILY